MGISLKDDFFKKFKIDDIDEIDEFENEIDYVPDGLVEFLIKNVDGIINKIIEWIEDEEFGDFSYEFNMVDVSDYIKLDEKPQDASEEEMLMHLQKPIEKTGKAKDKIPGWKPKKLKYQLPGESEVEARNRTKSKRKKPYSIK